MQINTRMFFSLAARIYRKKDCTRNAPYSTFALLFVYPLLGEILIILLIAGKEWSAFPGSVFIYVDDADAIFKRVLLKGCKQLQEVAQREYG